MRTGAEMLPAFRPLAAIIEHDRRSLMASGELTTPTYNNPMGAERWDSMSMKQYLDSKRGGQVEDWVLDMLGVAYTGEYGLGSEQQSALNLLVLVGTDTTDFSMFGISDESKRVKGGNSRLIDALYAAVKAQTPTHLGHELVKIADAGGKIRLTFKTAGGTQEVEADRVINTMPFSVLRRVEGLDALGLSERKLKCIKTLGYGTLSKFMIGFKSRYWREQRGAVAASTGSIYSDTRSRQFWESSRAQDGQSGIITNFLSAGEGKTLSPNQLSLSLQDLEKVWAGVSQQTDGNKALQAWPVEKYSLGAYTCPLVGQYTSIYGSALEPELNGRLLFAGEHCSVDWQGYMEGGAETGQAAAKLLEGQTGMNRTSSRRHMFR